MTKNQNQPESPKINAADRLQEAIAKLDISDLEARVLKELAQDPHGFDEEASSSMIASLVSATLNECTQALLNLRNRNLIVTDSNSASPRLVADYNRIGLSDADRNDLQNVAHPYRVIGAPHSIEALSSLDDLLRKESGRIYLGLEITSHKAFKSLSERVRKGYMTILLMPCKSQICFERRQHYDEVLKEWITFFNDEGASAKRNLRLYLTRALHAPLCTSLLCRGKARIDVYWKNTKTTRRGVILESPAGTSLYDFIHNEFVRAQNDSTPLLRFWPADWFKAKWKCYGQALSGVFLVVVAVFLFLWDHKWTPFIQTLLGSSGMALILGRFVERKSQWIDLFPNESMAKSTPTIES